MPLEKDEVFEGYMKIKLQVNLKNQLYHCLYKASTRKLEFCRFYPEPQIR